MVSNSFARIRIANRQFELVRRRPSPYRHPRSRVTALWESATRRDDPCETITQEILFDCPATVSRQERAPRITEVFDDAIWEVLHEQRAIRSQFKCGFRDVSISFARFQEVHRVRCERVNASQPGWCRLLNENLIAAGDRDENNRETDPANACSHACTTNRRVRNDRRSICAFR